MIVMEFELVSYDELDEWIVVIWVGEEVDSVLVVMDCFNVFVDILVILLFCV